MAKVVDQEIPSEYRDLYERYMDPVRPNDGVQLRKHHDGRKMSATLRTVMQGFREGSRMWSTKTKPERESWEEEAEGMGMDGRALFMKQWMTGVLSVGPFTVGGSTIPGWGSVGGSYVTARDRTHVTPPLITIHVRYQIGYSIVGGEAQIG